MSFSKNPVNSSCKAETNYHFIAMGGVGQSALAKILTQRGYSVSGSDISDSKYLKELKILGAKVFVGHNEDNLSENSSVVISSAIKEDNPELKKARALGLNVYHRSDMLNIISRDFPVFVGFAGTHGKTTTSGLMSYVLSYMEKDPAFAVGGIIPGLNTNANASKNSNIFIAELDESDGTIVKYAPTTLVINNLEADHLDFYKNGLPDVLETFQKLVLSLSKSSKIIVNIDDYGVQEFLKLNPGLDVLKFSTKLRDVNIFAKNITYNAPGASFEVVYHGKTLGTLETSLKGEHNVYNTLAVVSALLAEGFDFNEFAPHFKGFTGMGRRFQTVCKTENLEIIDDYAHHPSEIKATLAAAKEYKNKSGKKRVVAFFQPHRYTRLKALWDEFLTSFGDCDVLIVLDAYSAGDPFDSVYNSEKFAEVCKKAFNHPEVLYIQGSVDEVSNSAVKYIKDGTITNKDILLTLGAGDITKLGPKIADTLLLNGGTL